jgi:hypothetical protein
MFRPEMERTLGKMRRSARRKTSWSAHGIHYRQVPESRGKSRWRGTAGEQRAARDLVVEITEDVVD